MKKIFVAMFLAGCGGGGNDLSGSVSSVYSLAFTKTTAQFDPSAETLTVDYLKGADDSGGETIELVVDLTGLTISPGTSIDLTQQVNGGPRGTLKQVLDDTTFLSFSIGSLTLHEVPTVGKEISGHFAATFTDPSGYALQGDFDVASLAQAESD